MPEWPALQKNHEKARYFLVIIPDYRIQEKKNRLHLQANSDFLPLLICSKSSEPHPTLNAAPCSSNRFINKKTETYSDLETFGVGSSLSRNKFSTIPGHLFTEVTINREVKVRGDPMRARISQYFY